MQPILLHVVPTLERDLYHLLGTRGCRAVNHRRDLFCFVARARVLATLARVFAPRRALAVRFAEFRFRVCAALCAPRLRARSRFRTRLRISSAADVRSSTVCRANFSPATPVRRWLPSKAARGLATFFRRPWDRSSLKKSSRSETPGARRCGGHRARSWLGSLPGARPGGRARVCVFAWHGSEYGPGTHSGVRPGRIRVGHSTGRKTARRSSMTWAG